MPRRPRRGRRIGQIDVGRDTPSAHVVSSDALHAPWWGRARTTSARRVTRSRCSTRSSPARLRRRLTTVVDTLGTDAARRARWLAPARDAGVPCVAVIFDTPAAEVRRRNRRTPDRVPDAVLRRQLAEWPSVRQAVLLEPFDAHHVLVSEQRVAAASRRRCRCPRRPRLVAAARPGLRFGLQLPRFTWPGGPSELGERLRDIARRAEEAGFDTLWVMDHFRQIPQMGPAWEDMLESWTTLAHLAAITERIRLGTLVPGITYRNVAHLAKIVATLDVLSQGVPSAGSDWPGSSRSTRAYGWPFPTRAERYALLADALALLPQMWGPGGKPFHGGCSTSRTRRATRGRCRRTCRSSSAAPASGARCGWSPRYADACNLFGEPAVVAHKVAVLREHCAAVGRDPTAVSVSHLGTVLVGDDPDHVGALVERTRPPRTSTERHARNVHAGTVDQHVARVARYTDAGVDHVIVSLVDVADPGAIERYGSVIAASRSAGLMGALPASLPG